MFPTYLSLTGQIKWKFENFSNFSDYLLKVQYWIFQITEFSVISTEFTNLNLLKLSVGTLLLNFKILNFTESWLISTESINDKTKVTSNYYYYNCTYYHILCIPQHDSVVAARTWPLSHDTHTPHTHLDPLGLSIRICIVWNGKLPLKFKSPTYTINCRIYEYLSTCMCGCRVQV